METPLTILYTYGIRGDLDLLPRLYTFLRTLREQHQATARVLLMDAGASCEAGVWHCDVTGGRSTLIVLDAMGYDAANVEGILDDESRSKLVDQVRVALVDAANVWRDGDLLVTSSASDATPQVVLSAGVSTHLSDGVLHLNAVNKGQVGVVHWDGANITSEILTMPPDTQPDGTIAGAVDFVVGEARYYGRKRQPKNGANTE